MTYSAVRPYALAAARTVLGLLALATIRAQWLAAAKTPNGDPAHFFGYFTILSNILAALVLIFVALDPRPPYPFFNVDQNGWDSVAWTITILFFASLALAAAIRWAGNAHPWYRKAF